MKLAEAVRQVLHEGPATSLEVASTLGLSTRRAQVGLWILTNRGHARVTGTAVIASTRRGDRRRLKLYAITPAGMYLVRKSCQAERCAACRAAAAG